MAQLALILRGKIFSLFVFSVKPAAWGAAQIQLGGGFQYFW
jgi:hypothetical protein